MGGLGGELDTLGLHNIWIHLRRDVFRITFPFGRNTKPESNITLSVLIPASLRPASDVIYGQFLGIFYCRATH